MNKKEGQRDSELANKFDFTRTKKGIRCYPISRLQRAFIGGRGIYKGSLYVLAGCPSLSVKLSL